MFFKWDFDAERIAQERRRRRRKQRVQSFFDSHAYVWLVALIAAVAYFAMCIDW